MRQSNTICFEHMRQCTAAHGCAHVRRTQLAMLPWCGIRTRSATEHEDHTDTQTHRHRHTHTHTHTHSLTHSLTLASTLRPGKSKASTASFDRGCTIVPTGPNTPVVCVQRSRIRGQSHSVALKCIHVLEAICMHTKSFDTSSQKK
jgi:hypothetical protein